MKNISLLVAGLLFISCSKEKTHGPWNLRNGQEVEVMVSHRYGATDDILTLLPQKKTEPGSIYSFNDREPGYNYKVKARMVAPDVPPQDGPSYWLELVKVISKERYTGNDSFLIELVHYSFSGPIIMLQKENAVYSFQTKIALTAATPAITEKLNEISEYYKKYQEDMEIYRLGGMSSRPFIKWKSIRARVTHDPANFGKSYLVSSIDLTE